MIKTVQRGNAIIVLIENAAPLEQDLINQALRLEADYQKTDYEQMSLSSLTKSANNQEDGQLSEKEMEQLKDMPVFDKGKPSLKQVIANLSGNPFITSEKMKEILKAEYDYDYDPDKYNPEDLEER